MWEVFGTRGLFQASYGAADFGECRLAVDRVGAGGADDWYREWAALADGLVETADADAAAGRPASARDGYLRATTYYRVAYLPLYGEPTDPRLADAFAREADALAKYAPRSDTPVELVEIPFEGGATLPGVLALAADDGRPRATIVHALRRDRLRPQGAAAVHGGRRRVRALRGQRPPAVPPAQLRMAQRRRSAGRVDGR